MNEKIKNILDTWHKHFNDEENQYSEFEPSDIEYFVGCMLYNHFAFSKSLENLKTIDLSYDFLSSCGDEYDDVVKTMAQITFEKEEESLKFLQSFIQESRAKYSKPELYLLNRLNYHVSSLAERYVEGGEVQKVDFSNPLLRP